MTSWDVIENERKRWIKNYECVDAEHKADMAWWREFGDRLGWRVVDCLNRHRATFRTKHGGDIAITDLIRREIEDAWAPYQRALKAAGIVRGSDPVMGPEVGGDGQHVCVGDHAPGTLAAEAADRIARAELR